MFVIKVSIILLHCLGFICAVKDYEYNRPSNAVDYTNGNEFVNVNKFSEVDNTGYDNVASNDQTAHYSPTKYNNNHVVNDPKTGDIMSQSEYNDGNTVRGSYDYTAPKQLKVDYKQTRHYSPTKYNYSYAVNDLKTGDIKSHSETNDGYLVRGSYSLIDPDGFKRIVTYTADDLHGFNAIVHRVPYVLQTTSKPVPSVESRGPVTFVLNLMDPNGKHFVEDSSQRISQTAEILESTTPQVQSIDSYAAPPPLDNVVDGGPYV